MKPTITSVASGYRRAYDTSIPVCRKLAAGELAREVRAMGLKITKREAEGLLKHQH